jgi:hypothetical protein
MPACAGMRLRQSWPVLAGDGVGGLVVLDQWAKGVDEILNLGFLQPEEIELPCDLIQLSHGLFVGDAIGIHVYLLHLAQCSIGKQHKIKGTEQLTILK